MITRKIKWLWHNRTVCVTEIKGTTLWTALWQEMKHWLTIPPENKQQLKKLIKSPSVGKIMTAIFWDWKCPFLIEFLFRGDAINSAFYCETPKNGVTNNYHLFMNLKKHLVGKIWWQWWGSRHSDDVFKRAGRRLLWHQNQKTHSQAHKMLWGPWWCWNINKGMLSRYYKSITKWSAEEKFSGLCIFTFWVYLIMIYSGL